MTWCVHVVEFYDVIYYTKTFAPPPRLTRCVLII